jgi:hypothetical protein
MEAKVLLWVSAVSAIVLVIACANVANLAIVRVIRRRRAESLIPLMDAVVALRQQDAGAAAARSAYAHDYCSLRA